VTGLWWVLAGCTGMGPGGDTDPVLLGGSVTMSVDVTARRARLRIRTIQPAPGVVPAERHGLGMDECATLKPLVPLEGQVLRPATVEAWCDGEPVSLDNDGMGTATHLFPQTPDPGTVCELVVDGQTLTLPPLPVAPVVEVVRGRLSWEAGDADELRFVMPRSDGESTICRLEDDGDAKAPTGARLQLSFASRVALALPQLEPGSRLPIAVIAGTWRSP